MKYREFKGKLEKWEAEGYDVSELRAKWFPSTRKPGSGSPIKWIAIIAVIIGVSAAIIGWQFSESSKMTVIPTGTPSITKPIQTSTTALTATKPTQTSTTLGQSESSTTHTKTGAILIYQTDFSQDPQWVTNDPVQNYWDNDKEAYHYYMADGKDQYTYVIIPKPKGSFELEWDIFPNRTDWFSNHRFGIWNPEMNCNAAEGVYTQFVADENLPHNKVYLQVIVGHTSKPGTTFQPFDDGIWYHGTINYDRSSDTVSFDLTRISDGKVILNAIYKNIGEFSVIDRLGLSSVNDHGYPPAAAEGYIDNVKFSTIP